MERRDVKGAQEVLRKFSRVFGLTLGSETFDKGVVDGWNLIKRSPSPAARCAACIRRLTTSESSRLRKTIGLHFAHGLEEDSRPRRAFRRILAFWSNLTRLSSCARLSRQWRRADGQGSGDGRDAPETSQRRGRRIGRCCASPQPEDSTVDSREIRIC